MSAPARVLLYVEGDAAEVADAYHRISRELDGTPGLLGNELLASEHREGSFVVLSEWQSLDAFRAWESGEAHRPATSPLRPYLDHRRGPFGLYTVRASYS